MTTEHEHQKSQADTEELAENNTGGGSSSGLVGILLVILILTIGVGAFYLYQEFSDKNDKLDQSINGVKSKIDSLQRETTALRKTLKKDRKKLTALSAEVTRLGDNLEGISQQPLPTTSELAIAEVEHLLIIAAQRLSLSKDVAIALTAMQAADKRLAALSLPGLTEVREQLTRDMNALQSVTQVDIAGIALYLADISGRIDGLKLKNVPTDSDQTGAPNDAARDPESSSLFESIGRELRQMLIIKRRHEPIAILPDEQYYIYQNLKLELLNARQATLIRDTANMRESVKLALDLLNQYFDGNESTTHNLIEALIKMQTLELQPTIPDINSSLETVRAYVRHNKERPPAAEDLPSPRP